MEQAGENFHQSSFNKEYSAPESLPSDCNFQQSGEHEMNHLQNM
jgi:hypothetical protein